ncbi:MAG: hypothetical protein GY787_27210 [Alteromonadales bacterium]|jgi:hypothetical protein|nr:hypothetical protein [Alteromonadales bacterium]
MLNLSIQDSFDGTDKIGDLRRAVGTTYCDVTKLISVSKDGNTCVIEEQGKRKRQPSWLTWNRFFF